MASLQRHADTILTESPYDSTYKRVVGTLGEKGVVELVALVGFYDMTATLIKTFRFDKPEGVGPIFTR